MFTSNIKPLKNILLLIYLQVTVHDEMLVKYKLVKGNETTEIDSNDDSNRLEKLRLKMCYVSIKF